MVNPGDDEKGNDAQEKTGVTTRSQSRAAESGADETGSGGDGAVASTSTAEFRETEEVGENQPGEREDGGNNGGENQDLPSDLTSKKPSSKPSSVKGKKGKKTVGKTLLDIQLRQIANEEKEMELEERKVTLEKRRIALELAKFKEQAKKGHFNESGDEDDEDSDNSHRDGGDSDDGKPQDSTIIYTGFKEEKPRDTGTPLKEYIRKWDSLEDSRKYVTDVEEVKPIERKSEPPLQQQSQPGPSGFDMEKFAQIMANMMTGQNKTSEKFMARQSRERQLPEFDGNPIKWPIFYNRYKRSTEECGFSNQENMGRLERSLKGKAKDTVAALMIVPDNTQEVMETLKKRFGRPDYVVEALTRKIKEIQSPKESKMDTLQIFGDSLKSLVVTIKTMECPQYLANPSLLKELVKKLPESFRFRWGEHLMRFEGRIPSLEDFSRWTDRMAEIVSMTETPTFPTDADKDKNWRDRRNEKRRGRDFGAVNAHDDEPRKESNACQLCDKDGHSLYKCRTFGKMTLDDRWKVVKKKRLCFNCLKDGHRNEDCKSTWTCGVNGCSKRHNRLLHQEFMKKKREHRRSDPESEDDDDQPRRENKKQPSKPHVNNNPKPKTSNPASVNAVADEDGEEEENHHYHEMSSRKILLRVINVTLYNGKKKVNTCALLDEASTVTMMDQELANQLNLKGKTKPLTLKWSNGQLQKEYSSRRVNLQISGGKGKKFDLNNVRTVANLNLATQSYNGDELKRKWPHLREHIIPSFTGKPKILIGQEHQHLTLSRKVIEKGEEGPVITLTKLGWVLHGPTTKNPRNAEEEECCHCTHEDEDAELHRVVKETFQLENIGIVKKTESRRSQEDFQAEDLMKKVTKRIGDRFETGLLWRNVAAELPPSKEVAIKRLNGVQSKLRKNPAHAQEYAEKIKDYIHKGYARKITEDEEKEDNPKEWFLPHFGTFHPNKPRKMRFILDAASKAHGMSLNDALLTGPDLLVSLPGALLNFRQRKYAFTGDIAEMFHQVRIRKEDCPAQRFLWTEEGKSKPSTFQLEVMMFGSVCSPYQAQYVKNKNAEEFQEDYPAAAKAIILKHYMDDYLDCCDTEEDALQLIKEVQFVHKQGGFEIGKWVSNSHKIMEEMKTEAATTPDKDLTEWSEIPTERVLGLHWKPKEDSFTFRVKLERAGVGVADGSRCPCKREVLRLLMLIFDPLGMLGHFTIKGRILLQRIWQSKTGWDEDIPTPLYEKWKKWLKDLEKITELSIPRCYSLHFSKSENVQLHVFVDASEMAYAAVAYLRIGTPAGAEVSFVMSKTRVASLKQVSIPRMELQAALLGSRLGTFIAKEIEKKPKEIIFWSDSSTVLQWLKSKARRFHQFVANRIGEIQELTDVQQWRWIPSDLNVADDATRDDKTNMDCNGRWYAGPDFLKLPDEDWPKRTFQETLVLPELKKNDDEEVCAITHEESILPKPEKFSRWLKMLRVTAAVLEAIPKLQKRFARTSQKEWTTASQDKKKEIWISAPSMKKAETLLLRSCQRESFPVEIDFLTKKKKLLGRSRLNKLSPFLDDAGVLRMKSRIGIHPIILDPHHHTTKLIINHYHRMAWHQGLDQIRNEIRQKFWILHLRDAVKRAGFDCMECVRRKAKPVPAQMAPLPSIRTTKPEGAFAAVGMDYFGPMEVTVGRRREKRWGVLFTCMAVRAIHLEIAASLSTDSCIMAIRRFISKRGHPRIIISDNGTNLRGADAELKKCLEELQPDKIRNEMLNKGIEWRFNPPGAPHFGGAFERLIGSVKTAMKIVLKTQAPKEELLQTIMAEAEAIINSRPLTEIPVEPDEKEALTPMHFLIGRSSVVQPCGEFSEDDLFRRKQWKHAQVLAEQFWRRWLREYLPTLQRRSKWHHGDPGIRVGDIVVVVDETLKKGHFPLGRIAETFPGKDGIVRVVEVITANGSYRRPVTKVAKLDICHEEKNEDAAEENPKTGNGTAEENIRNSS